MRVDVVDAALRAAYGDSRGRATDRAPDPVGAAVRRRARVELAAEPELTLLCGRYEGVDERVREHLVTDAVSIGRYVLSGGELAAMVVADAVIRKLPGALGHADSAVRSPSPRRSAARPEYPHYTRPAAYRGLGGARGPPLRATTRACGSGGWSRAAGGRDRRSDG